MVFAPSSPHTAALPEPKGPPARQSIRVAVAREPCRAAYPPLLSFPPASRLFPAFRPPRAILPARNQAPSLGPSPSTSHSPASGRDAPHRARVLLQAPLQSGRPAPPLLFPVAALISASPPETAPARIPSPDSQRLPPRRHRKSPQYWDGSAWRAPAL